MPEEDKTELRTRDELMAKIAVSMGGRAAEEVVMNTMTNGASQDIQEATGVARNMVAMFGMSDQFGMMALAPPQPVSGRRLRSGLRAGHRRRYGQGREGYPGQVLCRRVNIIRENREDMDKVVAYLLEKETITGAEMVAIIEGRDPSTVEDAYASTLAHENGFRPSQPEVIEPAARKVHMISEKIELLPTERRTVRINHPLTKHRLTRNLNLNRKTTPDPNNHQTGVPSGTPVFENERKERKHHDPYCQGIRPACRSRRL